MKCQWSPSHRDGGPKAVKTVRRKGFFNRMISCRDEKRNERNTKYRMIRKMPLSISQKMDLSQVNRSVITMSNAFKIQTTLDWGILKLRLKAD